ncbi:MAG: CDP-alcohol phosphatidyltransferase family protein [Proteobacteria bacterium]|nr:CDP-alcohol phosphatidyltransferase family protein [Pseudomonadota bacterium]
MTPNHLTTLRLMAGLAAAGTLAIGQTPWPQVGAGLFVLSLFLDRADGELARLSGKSSVWGHRYDLISDCVCNALIFIALGISLRDSAISHWAIPLGLLAGAAVTSVLIIVMKMESAQGQRAAELQGYARFDPDDAMLAIPLGIWLGWSLPLPFAAAIGATLFAVVFYVISRRRTQQHN